MGFRATSLCLCPSFPRDLCERVIMPATPFMQITNGTIAPALLQLPWSLPLEDWPEEYLASLPRGISRHVVRFVGIDGRVFAIKEIGQKVAYHEYKTLRDLNRLGAPSVRPLAVITGRVDATGEPLTAALVTEHLEFSLPYRAVFSQSMRSETATRLIHSLAVLLVRLHLLNFFWGDVSLSNTLFRRDADSFSGYLVDAETGELQPKLSDQRRLYDVDIARVNIIGELMDLQSGKLLSPDVDAIEIGNRIVEKYSLLWEELTAEQTIRPDEHWKVQQRIDKLNALGFDVGELKLTSSDEGQSVHIRPRVVDAGHHHRALMRLTGLDVQENQARRILNAIETYRAIHSDSHRPMSTIAHEWLTHIFEPTLAAIPKEYSARLQPAQIFHEVLEHQWYLSEQAGHEIPLNSAAVDYAKTILPHRPDEERMLDQDPHDELSED
ncbi:lipopolysaccharide kinase (Kdo/WaaP) family [Corynebacterium pseudotuberculosis]|nr:lipopolysaccharide kinase (Kdo/WaaP) family [Corynebacterium pseudotuberculosis]